MSENSPLHSSFNWSIASRRKRDRKHGARIAWIDYSVVPKPRRRKIDIGLRLDLGFQSLFRGCKLCFINWQTLLGQRITFYDVHYTRQLLRAHHRDPVVRPGEQKARLISAAAHRVVP